jgi:hypothetical protein
MGVEVPIDPLEGGQRLALPASLNLVQVGVDANARQLGVAGQTRRSL